MKNRDKIVTEIFERYVEVDELRRRVKEGDVPKRFLEKLATDLDDLYAAMDVIKMKIDRIYQLSKKQDEQKWN